MYFFYVIRYCTWVGIIWRKRRILRAFGTFSRKWWKVNHDFWDVKITQVKLRKKILMIDYHDHLKRKFEMSNSEFQWLFRQTTTARGSNTTHGRETHVHLHTCAAATIRIKLIPPLISFHLTLSLYHLTFSLFVFLFLYFIFPHHLIDHN